jgi:ferritin-like protein
MLCSETSCARNADEWFAHYNYFVLAQTISGMSSPALRCLIREKSDRALVRAVP